MRTMNVTLSAVRRFYFEHRVTPKLRDKVAPRRAFQLLVTYMVSVNTEAGLDGAVKVGQFTLARQEGFMRWCSQRHNLSVKSISNYLSYIKAAFRFGARPRLIRDARGREREVQLLQTPFFIEDGETYISQLLEKPRSQPRNWHTTDEDMAKWLDALLDEPDLEGAFRYCIMGLNTWARPEAIFELSVLSQVDFERGIVDLNPPGRVQNKKVRPKIRLTDNIRGWLLYWNLEHPLTYAGKRVKNIDNRTLQKAAARAGLDAKKFTKYTLRHFMATRSRRVPGVNVTREERATWMGHVDQNFRTTELNYEALDPDYLVSAMHATDAIMVHLSGMMRKGTLLPPNVVREGRFTVIEGGTPRVAPATRKDAG